MCPLGHGESECSFQHRVSYASLRALAVAVKTDADVLEREFYAVNQPNGEFIEIPRWIRFLSDRLWFGGPRLSRRDFLRVEAFCIALAFITFAASFLVSVGARASVVRMTSVLPLIGGYLTPLSIRMSDRYRLWPGSENAPAETPRTWRSVAAEYAFFITSGILGTVVISWLIVG